MSALQPDVRFFEECVHTPRRKLPEYEGRSLKWGERTLLNCNDPGHIQKALCRDVRQRCLNFVVQGYYIYMSRNSLAAFCPCSPTRPRMIKVMSRPAGRSVLSRCQCRGTA